MSDPDTLTNISAKAQPRQGRSAKLAVYTPGESYYEYFDYETYTPFAPASDGAIETTQAVVIVGGGPVGLTMALDLARFGVRSIVLEDDCTLSYGSRAGCIARRSLEVFARVGALDSIERKGLPWTTGTSFYRDAEVLRFDMPMASTDRFAPMVNMPQNYVEQYLYDKVRTCGLIDVRWGQKVTAIAQDESRATIDVDTQAGRYRLHAPWLVACDGARSVVRRSLGLRLEGESYGGRYLIADIRIDTPRPVGRLAWFDPPSNPGSTILMHKLTDEIWRVDYQLLDGEDEEAAKQPEAVKARVAAHLDWIGERGDWQLSWISIYKANALTLGKYRHGRVMFIGDAAHPIPIFGVRGMNSGLDDAHNLGWKLAAVVQGRAGDSLLDTFSGERREATENNLRNARKSTVFMSPPTPAYETMRRAVLSLASTRPWVAQLINPRQSSASNYTASSLKGPDEAEAFDGGPRPGEPMAECPVVLADGTSSHVSGLVGTKPVLMVFGAAAGRGDIGDPGSDCEVVSIDLCDNHAFSASVPTATRPGHLSMLRSHARQLFGITDRGAYLVRPDGYVAARWATPDREAVRAALSMLYPTGVVA